MIGVTRSKKTAATLGSLIEHAIPPRIGRSVRNAVQHHMNINPGTQGFMEGFPSSALDDFFDREIQSFRLLSVKQRGSDPDFIGNFPLGFGSRSHGPSFQGIFIKTKYFRNVNTEVISLNFLSPAMPLSN
jgi:hypothetical protein